ncbi:hypothetical protein CEXT_604671 [Caerostris extrusa]|uniref:Secreted protein n=1 Tax=Caerostris extrusa TaxID=172846 RepID=A0AAV4VZB1_CAEEX|nr:hypothetical protein CEXT_604671 [Caerostris extrusa]
MLRGGSAEVFLLLRCIICARSLMANGKVARGVHGTIIFQFCWASLLIFCNHRSWLATARTGNTWSEPGGPNHC